MIKEMYKVVRMLCSDMISCSPVSGEFALCYRINKKTTPKIGKIFVFPDLYSAIAFAYPGEIILVGEAENPQKITMIVSTHDIIKFWNLKSKKKGVKSSINVFCAPKNSYVCDTFIPRGIVEGVLK